MIMKFKSLLFDFQSYYLYGIKILGMKKLFLICFLGLFLSADCLGQWIQNLWTNPSILTTNTLIELIAEVDFPSGDCNDKTLIWTQNGNVISCHAMHCIGVATFICNDKDTFHIGTLPAGTYTFLFQADMGNGPSPCTPGIVPGPVDSLTFVVNQASSIGEIDESAFILFPNPVKNFLQIRLKDASRGSYKIVNSLGELVSESKLDGSTIEIEVVDLANGLYTFIFEDMFGNASLKKFTKL
jgi:hypothetical protein